MKDVNMLIENGVNIKSSLELFGDMSTYDEMLEEFLNGINEKLDKLQLYKEKMDISNYATYVHSLKSDAKYFGFDELATLAYTHETEAKANNSNFIFENYDFLISEIKKIIILASKYLGVPIKEEVKLNVVSNKNSILVADDSDVIVTYVKKIFKDMYDVKVARDGKEVLDIIQSDTSNNIIACLLDLNMPIMNGFDVLEYFTINDLFSKIPVSIITSYDSKEALQEVFNYPIVDVLSKPFNEANIKNIVQKTINSVSNK